MTARLNVTAIAFVLISAAVEVPSYAQGPDRPDEAFTIYVRASLGASELGGTGESGEAREWNEKNRKKYTAEKLKKEVEKRIKKLKKWFVVAKTPEKAEIFVDLVRHTVDEQMRHKMVSRVNVSGNGKDWVTETWSQETHSLQVRIEAFGIERLLEGVDARENGGSLKRAAQDLANKLELLCRENYEELSRLRREHS